MAWVAAEQVDIKQEAFLWQQAPNQLLWAQADQPQQLEVAILRFHQLRQQAAVGVNQIDRMDLLTLAEVVVVARVIKVVVVVVQVVVVVPHLLQEHIQIPTELELPVLLVKATVVATDITAGPEVTAAAVQD
jgi:hypothetical protein